MTAAIVVSDSCEFVHPFCVPFVDPGQLDLVDSGEYGGDENDEGGEKFDL